MSAFAALSRPLVAAWSRRLFAAGGAALVLALSVLAASPQLHRWMHPDAGQPDHECAITLFHHGVAGPVLDVLVAVAPLLWAAVLWTAPGEPDLIAPRFRLNPGRAPPRR